jgi:hypothetical protein
MIEVRSRLVRLAAIQQIAATANAKDELKRAKKQATDDVKGTNLFG